VIPNLVLISTLQLAILAAGVPSPAASPSPRSSPAPTTAIRETVLLADGWRFRQDDAIHGAERAGFVDSSWAVVRVPHTWNRVGYYLPDPASHVNRAETIDKAQGVGWYRLNFTPPAGFQGKRVWLEFDAASRVAKVWLNGMLLGEHKGGFSRFRLDATTALRAGHANVLAVQTDNSNPAVGSSTADVLPLRGDFFVHGGLYRPVRLIATDAVHIDMLDFGGPGVYATTTSVEGGRAQVAVRTRVRNDGARAARLVVTARLLDRTGAVAGQARQSISVSGADGAEVAHVLTVPGAHLWQGTEDPYLYRLIVDVTTPDGRELDRLEQDYGIRTMRFDAQAGFTLNGRPLRLRGVGMHQDREGKGWALDAADVASDVAIIREMGANTIRLTHYQHGPTIHDVADRQGLVLWDELPLVSAWTLAPGQTEATPALVANARQQLQELIRQNSNHASVAVWSIANEVDFGNSMPAFLGGGAGPAPDPIPLLRELNVLAKAEDPSRPTTLATCCEERALRGDPPVTAAVADLGGANRYFGWYFGVPEDLDAHLDALHAKRPGQPLAVTEYGAGGATTIHTDDARGGPADSRGRLQPEEYESDVHERNWAILNAKPYLFATWLWNSFDFASTSRHEGDAEDINTKGLVTFDRRIKKDAFFFYKANWTATPTVHVNGRRYVERAYPVTDVRVYSNAPATELVVNGRSLTALTAAECPQRSCVWKGVPLSVGDNEIVAKGRFAETSVEDRITWRLASSARDAIRIDSGALVAASSSGRFGSDAFFEGGAAGSVNAPPEFGRRPEKRTIAGTKDSDSDLVATFREGDFRYRVPVENGRYTVALTFVEPAAAAGERQFDVIASGVPALAAFDIAATAGAPLTAVTRTFAATVENGVLDLQFRPVKGKAIVSAIEVAAQR
jgi:beta-galactosidase